MGSTSLPVAAQRFHDPSHRRDAVVRRDAQFVAVALSESCFSGGKVGVARRRSSSSASGKVRYGRRRRTLGYRASRGAAREVRMSATLYEASEHVSKADGAKDGNVWGHRE